MTDAAPTRSSVPRTAPRFTLTDEAAPFSLTGSAWLREVWTRDHAVLRDEDWFVDSSRELLEGLPGDIQVLHHTTFERWEAAVLEVGEAIALVSLHRGSLDVSVAGRNASEVDACLARVKEL